jgi:hypothetical protein
MWGERPNRSGDLPFLPLRFPQRHGGGRRRGHRCANQWVRDRPLVLGIAGAYGVTAILALIFGYRARREIDESNGQQTGRGLAVAGIVLGWVGIGLFLVGAVLFFAVFLPIWHSDRPFPFQYPSP